MFPESRAAWNVLMIGVLALCAAAFLAIAREELQGAGFVVVALMILALAVLLFLNARDKRVEEEAEEPARLRAAAERPLESMVSSIEETTEPLRKWATRLGVLALVVVPFSLMRTASDAPQDSVILALSGLTWGLMAVAAWRVAKTASRAWSVVLLAIPAADIVAMIPKEGSIRGANPFVPLFFLVLGARCCWLTFRYHRRLRNGA